MCVTIQIKDTARSAFSCGTVYCAVVNGSITFKDLNEDGIKFIFELKVITITGYLPRTPTVTRIG